MAWTTCMAMLGLSSQPTGWLHRAKLCAINLRGYGMHDIGFIRDLALVMLVAGATTILFQRFRLPVLPGYILAGVVIGPHTPGVLVADPRAISDISNLGVILLMFTLGLEFSVRKLRQVGGGLLLVTVIEVGFMLWLGYQLGLLFGWSSRS